MGKDAKVSRWLSILVPIGSSVCILESAASTSCSVWNMSTCQLKNRSTSAVPRLVMERTTSRPGTLLTACSTGRVTVTIIWSMGMTPLSMPITMRGKSVEGKTETGMVSDKYAPTKATTMITKMTDLEFCANHGCFIEVSSPLFLMFSSSAIDYLDRNAHPSQRTRRMGTQFVLSDRDHLSDNSRRG